MDGWYILYKLHGGNPLKYRGFLLFKIFTEKIQKYIDNMLSLVYLITVGSTENLQKWRRKMKQRLEKQLKDRWDWFRNDNIDYSLKEFKEDHKGFENVVYESYHYDLISNEEYNECKDVLEKYIDVIIAVEKL